MLETNEKKAKRTNSNIWATSDGCNDPYYQLLLMTQSEITETQFLTWVGSFYEISPEDTINQLASGTLPSLNKTGMYIDSQVNGNGVTCGNCVCLIPNGPDSSAITFLVIPTSGLNDYPTYYPIGLFRGLLTRYPDAGLNLSFDFYNANLCYANGGIRVPGRVILRLTCTLPTGNNSITYWDLSGSVPPPPPGN